MWSARMAERFNTTADAARGQSGWLFLSPNLIGFLLFFAGPLIFSLVISFYEWNGITTPTFVGFGNYVAHARPHRGEHARTAAGRLRGHPRRRPSA